MEKGKAIFVTVLITVMLAAIDGCLYALSTSSFTLLTGAFVVYGVLRWALDFYRWLSKPGAEPTQQDNEPLNAEVVEHDNREPGKKVIGQSRPDRSGAIMSALSEEI